MPFAKSIPTAMLAVLAFSFTAGPSVAGSNSHGNKKGTSALRVPAGSKILLPNIRWAKDPHAGGRLWRYTDEDKRNRGFASSPNIQDHLEGLISITPGGRR